MEYTFFKKYVVERNFIFTVDELCDILESVLSNVKDQCPYYKYHAVSWETNCKMPSTPSPLKKRISAMCYLIYYDDGDIGVKYTGDITDDDYLLAEMNSETDFEITPHCEIV
uniref:Phage protein n=1 Tax=Panagrolaimus davidi TaxID=227884 RepID=A0A914PZ95_9BILA